MIYARTFKDTSSSTNKSFVTKQQTIFNFFRSIEWFFKIWFFWAEFLIVERFPTRISSNNMFENIFWAVLRLFS